MEIKTKYSIGDWVYRLDGSGKIIHDFIVEIKTTVKDKIPGEDRKYLNLKIKVDSINYLLSLNAHDTEPAWFLEGGLYSSKGALYKAIPIEKTYHTNYIKNPLVVNPPFQYTKNQKQK